MSKIKPPPKSLKMPSEITTTRKLYVITPSFSTSHVHGYYNLEDAIRVVKENLGIDAKIVMYEEIGVMIKGTIRY